MRGTVQRVVQSLLRTSPVMMPRGDCVIIPTFREAPSAPPDAPSWKRAHGSRLRMGIFVDDDSPDGPAGDGQGHRRHRPAGVSVPCIASDRGAWQGRCSKGRHGQPRPLSVAVMGSDRRPEATTRPCLPADAERPCRPAADRHGGGQPLPGGGRLGRPSAPGLGAARRRSDRQMAGSPGAAPHHPT